MTFEFTGQPGAAGGVRHSDSGLKRPGKVRTLVARLSPTKSQVQVQLDDGYLLALAKQGSPDAYDRLVRRYASFVRLKASSYFLVGGDSEDLVQEGLVGLYKAIRDFRSDRESSFLLSGAGDVIAPDDGIVAVGSGAPYALAAARALVRHTGMDAGTVALEAMKIAAQICVYTNANVVIETLDA